MPPTELVLYQEADGSSPVVEWMRQLRVSDRAGFANCLARIRMLSQFGFELRRPAADYLRDGVYELRAKRGTLQYRILYFFAGRNMCVLTHAMVKRGSAVPEPEMRRALERKSRFEKNPALHSYQGEIEDA